MYKPGLMWYSTTMDIDAMAESWTADFKRTNPDVTDASFEFYLKRYKASLKRLQELG